MLNDGNILTASEMRAAEQQLIDNGTSVEALMQRAGEGAARWIWRVFGSAPTLVICGPGNNGGDGYVIAEWLRNRSVDVSVAASSPPKTTAAKLAAAEWQGETAPLNSAKPKPLVVDCLFGTGLTRPIEPAIAELLQKLTGSAKHCVAVDIPSGIQTDDGGVLTEINMFDLTVALGAYKPAHFLEPSKSTIGELVGVEIGIDFNSKLHLQKRPALRAPASTDHKYTRGLIGVIVGEMPGAAQLTALAAQHSGAGYVKLFSPERSSTGISSIVNENYSDLTELRNKIADPRISILVIGPGLGRGKASEKLLNLTLESDKPLVIDADCFAILGDQFARQLRNRNAPVIATPHYGEFQSIVTSLKGSKLDKARELAQSSNCVVLLKGSDTVIADIDGEASVSGLSSPWLSTAGTGDVLAGVIATRYAVESNAYKAANQAQWLHSRAAKLAGPAFTPEKLIDMIPHAIQECL